MKVIFTKHVLKDKLPAIKRFGWEITRKKIKIAVRHPRWRGVTKRGQETAMSLVDKEHILRVVFRREGDIITIITVHIARRGKYGSTLR